MKRPLERQAAQAVRRRSSSAVLTPCDLPETLSAICQVSLAVAAAEKQLNIPHLLSNREAILL
jgi:hypothetical protein